LLYSDDDHIQEDKKVDFTLGENELTKEASLRQTSSPVPIFTLADKEISGSHSESPDKLEFFSQHQSIARMSSKDSFQERRKLSKKYSTASTSSFGGLSLGSSFNESPYIHLISDDRDRRSTESSEIAFKRKISEGPSAFIRMTSAEEHEIDTDFVLGKLEVKDEMNKDDPFPENIQDPKMKLKPIKSSFKPPKPPRHRTALAKKAAVTRMGGSKVFENYEAEMRNKFGKDKLQELYTVQESEKSITSNTNNGLNDVSIMRRASEVPGLSGGQYLTVQPQPSSSFHRGGVARSTVCLAQIDTTRQEAVESSKRRPPPRSSSFRKSVQKLGGEFAKTWKNLTGK